MNLRPELPLAMACAENVQHDYQQRYYSDRDAHLPTANKPDF